VPTGLPEQELQKDLGTSLFFAFLSTMFPALYRAEQMFRKAQGGGEGGAGSRLLAWSCGNADNLKVLTGEAGPRPSFLLQILQVFYQSLKLPKELREKGRVNAATACLVVSGVDVPHADIQSFDNQDEQLHETSFSLCNRRIPTALPENKHCIQLPH